MADRTITDSIEENAKDGIKRASDDNGSMEVLPLQEQIAADKYVRGQRAATRSALPIRHVKNVLPGSV